MRRHARSIARIGRSIAVIGLALGLEAPHVAPDLAP
jgi:hypothetical protein